ncbi:hypothetical protein RRG08_005109 [Elysia crispata]|uniref:Uncharacterized protein n=1 Tax=Elysia crispata TaxID=231223 RepID=A0AAE1B5R7_9GAST|nr:hypothetical protein RRG08_005109 [Elysia crispata]
MTTRHYTALSYRESSVRVDSTKSHRATCENMTTRHYTALSYRESSVRVDSTKSHRATRQHDNMTLHRAVLKGKFSPGR